MKMVKKILLGLTAAAAVISFVSCSGIANDNAEEEGKKDDKKITVDASSSDKNYEADKDYKRAFVQLGKLEQVQEVTSTLTFNKDEVGNGVVGYAFDLNYDKDAEDKDIDDSYNFVLIGFNPSLGMYYVERYKGVSMDANNGYTNAKSLGKYISYINGSWTTEYVTDKDDFVTATEGKHYSVDTDGNVTIKITVTQATDLKYEVKLGSEKIAEYTRTDKSAKDPTKYVNVTKEGKAQGGIAVYANAKNGLKFSVKCTTDKDSVKGKFEAEEE